MSTLQVSNIQTNSATYDVHPVFKTSGGTENGRLVGNWVRKLSGYDGQGNGTAGSFNTSSLTQISTGRWRVNLTNAYPDTNYAVIATGARNNSDTYVSEDFSDRTTSRYAVVIHNWTYDRFDFGFSSMTIRN